MELEKATLCELDNRRGRESRTSPREVGDPIPVQFNPSTLKLVLKNVHDRGENEGRQVRQFMGKSSDTYTLELHFDSADEGRDDGEGNFEPISVREKTQLVERFLKPGRRNATPPRLRFHWGDFIIDGVLDSLDLQFDHFAANGLPLRAKATLTLKQQDSSYEVLPESETEAGNSDTRPTDSAGGQPGQGGAGGPNEATAQGGETPAELAARLGLDPLAWRGLDIDLDLSLEAGVGLSLAAGVSVGFDASLGVSAGLGVHVGFEADVSASLEASFGLSVEGSASLSAGATASFSAAAGARASAEVGAGFRLSAAGGVEAAIEATASIAAAAAAASASAAFSSTDQPRATLAPTPSGPSRPSQARKPLARVEHRLGARVEHEVAPPLPRVDPRAVSYGRGVPLNQRVRTRADGRPHERKPTVEPPLAAHPSQAPWVALPVVDRGRRAADVEQDRRRPSSSCDCSCSSSRRKRRGGR
ncbi:MAG TPA: hypothetical protein VK034_00305 [Enhygromyxa sp.]|nr:hypothetical protein [Enhygromyxa sp.]